MNQHQATQPGALTANAACFASMFLWATGFPVAEVLLESWGALSLILAKHVVGLILLVGWWLHRDGVDVVRTVNWPHAFGVGAVGFGIGSILLLLGQKYSDAVTPALAAAMMPIAGAALEVVLDRRRLRWWLILGIALAIAGGIIAVGTNLADARFSAGALMCLAAVVLFAWVTRATTRDFAHLSLVGRTTVTLFGAVTIHALAVVVCAFAAPEQIRVGDTDALSVGYLFWFGLVTMAIAQMLWIGGAGGLGILLASFHMNAVPFYVMLIMVVAFAQPWGWWQAIGAVLVACGVTVAQLGPRVAGHKSRQ